MGRGAEPAIDEADRAAPPRRRAEIGLPQQEVAGRRIAALVEPPDIFAGRPFEVGDHQPEDPAVAEQPAGVGERLVELVERQVFQHVAGIDAAAALLGHRQPLDDVADPDIGGKALGILGPQRAQQRNPFPSQGRRGVEVQPLGWRAVAAAILDVAARTRGDAAGGVGRIGGHVSSRQGQGRRRTLAVLGRRTKHRGRSGGQRFLGNGRRIG